MNWMIRIIKSSIGKKLLMALTGLGFISFLLVHLAGNLTLYSGQNVFNAYSQRLHALGPLVTITEWGLLFFAAVHIVTGLTLFVQNWLSRPVRYRKKKWAGGRSIGSATMPYTGVIILAFVIFHLINFHFVDKTGTTLYQIVFNAFSSPLYVAIYVFAVIVVAVHISHGFWSLFQTFGANHPKYTTLIRGAGVFISLLFGIGFGFIPVYLSFFA
jgi:succinate dehydrogenase / fumarate reductase cytochrome b subunit